MTDTPNGHTVLPQILSELVTVLRQQAGIIQELLNATEASRLCGLSPASWWRRHSAAEVPAAVHIGGATRWRRLELLAWIESGCPARKVWEAMKK